MIQFSPYAKGKTIGNRTDLSIVLLITHLDFGIACNHSNDCLTEHRFNGFSISVLQQILAAQVLLAGTNRLKHVTPLLTEN